MDKKTDKHINYAYVAASILIAIVGTHNLGKQCDADAKRIKEISQIAKPSKSEKDEVELIYSRPAYESICRFLNTPLKEEEQTK